MSMWKIVRRKISEELTGIAVCLHVNVTGIFLCVCVFQFAYSYFTQLFLCFTFPTWMSTLIYQSQKLSTYINK